MFLPWYSYGSLSVLFAHLSYSAPSEVFRYLVLLSLAPSPSMDQSLRDSHNERAVKCFFLHSLPFGSQALNAVMRFAVPQTSRRLSFHTEPWLWFSLQGIPLDTQFDQLVAHLSSCWVYVEDKVGL